MNGQAVNINKNVFNEWLVGIVVNEDGELLVDSTHPKAIPITATNTLTKEVKHYMLRVTSKGGLCLV